ncbi:MAG: hypothetical protein ISF22_03520 [Methanomassiliicoccus sp.]|nr:hypothetical protein [Methanomassiliicoccus sp.]
MSPESPGRWKVLRSQERRYHASTVEASQDAAIITAMIVKARTTGMTLWLAEGMNLPGLSS